MKKCSKCGETKALDAFHHNASRKDGLATACKRCVAAWSRDSGRAKTPKEQARLRAFVAKRRAERPGEQREMVRRADARGRRELRDYYVITQICKNTSTKRSEVTPEFIQLKREQLSLKRAYWELKKTLEEMQ